MIEVLKHESARLVNDSSQSWNDTFEAWRAFLEVFTSNYGFEQCSGTNDCIDYFFEGAKEFYEFEDSPRGLEIKGAIPQLREMIKSLSTDALTMQEAEKLLHQAFSLLNKMRDDSVLCGGTPLITFSPQKEVILLPGDSLLLRCTAESVAKLRYFWKRNDKVIAETADGTLYVHSVNKEHEGVYVCVVSNNKGSTLSNVTIVRIQSKPNITLHPQPQRVIARSQIPAMFICNATGRPTPTFQWFFQSTNSSAVKVNKTKPVLYMSNPRQHHEGYYYCEASNDHGTVVSQRARLDVLGYTIGLPRLLIALNISTQCRQASNSSNSSVQNPLPCDSNYTAEELPSSINKAMQENITFSLAISLDVTIEQISHIEYSLRNPSTATVAFILDIDNELWKEDNFTSYMEIVEAIVVAETNLRTKLEMFNSFISNKTLKIPWDTTTLQGEPGSLVVLAFPSKCPEGQKLNENGFICCKYTFITLCNYKYISS